MTALGFLLVTEGSHHGVQRHKFISSLCLLILFTIRVQTLQHDSAAASVYVMCSSIGDRLSTSAEPVARENHDEYLTEATAGVGKADNVKSSA